MKREHSMRSKILCLCLGITLMALVLQTILFESTSTKLIYNKAKEDSFSSLQNMQNDVCEFVKSIESSLIKVYNEKGLLQSLRRQEKADLLREENYRMAYSMGTENFTTDDGVVALYLYTSDHQIISTYRRAVTPKHNYPTDIYASQGEQNNAKAVKDYVESDQTAMLISSYYNTFRETDIVRFVLKIYNKSKLTDKLGYLVCDVDSKALRTIMEKYSLSDEVFMWLQPMGDRPIVSIGSLDDTDRKYYEEIARNVQDSRKELGEQPVVTKRVFFQVPQNKYNLSAYSLMPQSILAQNQKNLTKNLILIAVIMIITAVIATTYVSKSLTKPLENLMDTITRIRGGETELRVQRKNQDEIGALGQRFNEMLDEMDKLLRREYETKLLLNRAEYKALQAQINPHFLYNTLDTMSSIAEIQNCRQVSSLSQSLSNIFRYSLDMKNPLSTVAKEIVHLKNYIYVMNVRMMDNVEYLFDIDEEVLQDTLPRITIQPLVENALNHGLKNKRGPKKILVKAKTHEKCLRIMVCDNGVGISQERMESILNGEEPEGGTSIGLKNIYSRIKMLYGESAGMKIESKVEEGTMISLLIPRVRMEEINQWIQ